MVRVWIIAYFTDAYCLSNIVRDLGLMTNLKAKLATIKAHMDQQQEHLENEMQGEAGHKSFLILAWGSESNYNECMNERKCNYQSCMNENKNCKIALVRENIIAMVSKWKKKVTAKIV